MKNIEKQIFMYEKQNIISVSYLRMYDGQSVHPNPPAAILVLYGVMQQHPKQRIDHIRELLLLGVLRVDVCHGYEPLLPHRHLEYGPSVLPVVIAKQSHVR